MPRKNTSALILKKIMSRKKKTIGIRALASAHMRMLHPSAAIRERFLNPDHGHRHQGLPVVCRVMKKVNNCGQMTIIMRRDNVEEVELYCVESFVQIETEGAAEHFFTATLPIDPEEKQNKEERVLENAVLFLGADRLKGSDDLWQVLAMDQTMVVNDHYSGPHTTQHKYWSKNHNQDSREHLVV